MIYPSPPSPIFPDPITRMEQERRPDLDVKKRKRMQSNRESARRSRMRKQQHLGDLATQAVGLREANRRISAEVKLRTERCARVEAENWVIRAQVAELAERLRSMNSLLGLMEAAGGVAMAVHEIPDPFLQPWRLPYPVQPIIASADAFHC